jgi:hypothetical protein
MAGGVRMFEHEFLYGLTTTEKTLTMREKSSKQIEVVALNNLDKSIVVLNLQL